MNNEKLKKLSFNLCADKENYMQAFRKNVDMYLSQKDITLREISEKADISFDTLKNFVYKDTSDCKLSTAVKLARAFGVSIDELVGAETIEETTRNNIARCRNLPDNALYLVRWYINYMITLNKNNEPNKKYVSIMQLEKDKDGNLKLTSNYEHINIDHIHNSSKIFFGISNLCNNYMPTYTPYNILLIANDRPPMFNEHCLIRVGKYVYIARQRIENGKIKYYSIRDNKYRLTEDDIDEHIGYIAEVI